jgi:hypothetical protein
LDEVFWRIFAGEDYIGLGQLRPHSADHELRWKFICYVNAILNSADEHRTRYLSKNNNNILRLATIRECFPNALIVVPFRHPLFHSESLLRQHLNFSKLQTEDSFVGAYMSWLAHHEFGLDHRPFVFDGDLSKFDSDSDPELAEYWLNVWCRTYEWLEASAPADTVFVCYETLCSDPEVWEALAGLAEISGANLNHEPFVVSENDSIEVQDQNLVSKALDLYERLRHQAQSDLDV